MNKQDFAAYIKRRLGEPVINVEIADEQIYDCIDDTVQLFMERHYDGSERVFIKRFITRNHVLSGKIDIPANIVSIVNILAKPNGFQSAWIFDNARWNIMDEIRRQRKGFSGSLSYFYISIGYIDMLRNMLSPMHDFDFNYTAHEMIPHFRFSDMGSTNLYGNDDFNTWSTQNCAISSGNQNLITGNAGYQIIPGNAGICTISKIYDTSKYIRYRYSFSFYSLSDVAIDITVQDSIGNTIKTYQAQPSTVWVENTIWFDYLDTHADDIIIKLSYQSTTGTEKVMVSDPKLYANNFLILECYESVDPQNYVDVLNNRWVKNYATALAKLRWGSNLKKYNGIQMPGGVELNGQQIFDEAKEEIEQLKEQLDNEFNSPIPFIIG